MAADSGLCGKPHTGGPNVRRFCCVCEDRLTVDSRTSVGGLRPEFEAHDDFRHSKRRQKRSRPQPAFAASAAASESALTWTTGWAFFLARLSSSPYKSDQTLVLRRIALLLPAQLAVLFEQDPAPRGRVPSSAAENSKPVKMSPTVAWLFILACL